ncbi:MAG: hypothetical protein OEV42_14205 [Deltaproteobacteria bacterium]|nr:hypothetical protein [Deltaproteobacteria bacterium]
METPFPSGNQKDISSKCLQLLVDSALYGRISASMRGLFCLTIKLSPLIAGIMLSLQTSSTYAAQPFIGVSTNWALLKGEEKSTGYDVAEMNSDEELEPALSVKSLNNYIANSSFGYFVEFGIESYSLSGSGEDNTGIDGEYLYLTPTVFYDFLKNSSGDHSFKIGAGFGLGYMSAEGRVMVEGPGLPIKTIDGKDFGTSIGLMLEYKYKNWVFQAKEYTPGATIDGIDFIIELPTFILGYRFD